MTTSAGPQQETSRPQTSGPEQPQHAEGERPQGLRRHKRIDKSVAHLEHTAKRVGNALQRPVLGASVAGGLVAAAAGLWGATEAALGAFVGVLAYRALKKRRERNARAREEQQPAPAAGG